MGPDRLGKGYHAVFDPDQQVYGDHNGKADIGDHAEQLFHILHAQHLLSLMIGKAFWICLTLTPYRFHQVRESGQPNWIWMQIISNLFQILLNLNGYSFLKIL